MVDPSSGPSNQGMPAKGQLAQNVSNTESIQTFRRSHRKDSHRSLSVLFDFFRMPKNLAEASFHQSPKRAVDKTTAGAVLLHQYYRM